MGKSIGILNNGTNYSAISSFYFLKAVMAVMTMVFCFTANASEVAVPCSDETLSDSPDSRSDLKGKAELGQRPCIGSSNKVGVKTEVSKHLGAMVGHLIKHYYTGALVGFSDSNDPKNNGFCKIKQVSQPVCELASGEIDSNKVTSGIEAKCGSKPTHINAAKSIDLNACFSSIPTANTICGPQMYSWVESEMADVKARKEYHSSLANVQSPMKAYHVDEAKKYSEIETKSGKKLAHLLSVFAIHSSTDNSEYCTFRRNGLDESTCGKEMAWIRGFRVSAWKKNLQKVQDEINAGKVATTAYKLSGGLEITPCQSYADSIDKLLNSNDPKKPGIRKIEEAIFSRWGEVAAELGTNTEDGALGLDTENFSSVTDAINKTKSKIDSHFKKNSIGITMADKHASFSVLALSMARRRVESLFTKFALCEVLERSRRDFASIMKSGNGGIFGELKSQVIKPCKEYAEAEATSETDGWSKFYSCYRTGIGGTTSVTKFFQKISNENSNYDQSRVPAIEELKTFDRAIASNSNANGYSIVSGGKTIKSSEVPFCRELKGFDPSLVGASGLSLFFRKRKKYKKKKTHTLSKWIKVISVCLLSIAQFACDDDSSVNSGGNGGGGVLVCEDGNVPTDENGATVKYTGGMQGSDYLDKNAKYCIEKLSDDPPFDGLMDEYEGEAKVAEAQSFLSGESSNTIAKKVNEKQDQSAESSATEGEYLKFNSPLKNKNANSGNSADKNARNLAGNLNQGTTSNVASGKTDSSIFGFLGFVKDTLEKKSDSNNNDAISKPYNNDTSGLYQGTVGNPFSGSNDNSNRVGVLESSGAGGAQGGLLEGISLKGPLTLFQIVNKRYDTWNRSALNQ